MGSELPPSPGGYDVNLPCATCGYNLRGLQLEGACPECGRSNADSLAVWKQRRRHAPQPMTVASWVTALSEGVALSLLGFALIIILVISPRWMYEWRTTQRSVTLGIACTAWVLCWYGTWKLTRPDPTKREQPHAQYLRILCRMDATFFFLLPFMMIFEKREPPHAVIALLGIPIVFTILTTGAACYLHLLSLARRMQSVGLAKAAIVLSVTNAFVFFWPIMVSVGSSASLEKLLSLPTCAFGAPEVARDGLHWLNYSLNYGGELAHSIVGITFLVELLLAGAFHVALFTKLRATASAIRAAETTPPPAPARTFANLSP